MFDDDRKIAIGWSREIDRLADLRIAGRELYSLGILHHLVHFGRRIPFERLNLNLESLPLLGRKSEAIDVVSLEQASGNCPRHGDAIGVRQVIVRLLLDPFFQIAYT